MNNLTDEEFLALNPIPESVWRAIFKDILLVGPLKRGIEQYNLKKFDIPPPGDEEELLTMDEKIEHNGEEEAVEKRGSSLLRRRQRHGRTIYQC